MVCGFFGELREFSAGIFRTILCLFCAGPLLAFVGIGFLASTSSDDRGKAVGSFNDAVAAWQQQPTGGGYARFDNFTAVSVSSASGSLSLSRTTVADSFPDTDGVTLPTSFLKRMSASTTTVPFAAVSYVDPSVGGPVNGYSTTLTIGTTSAALGPRSSQELATMVTKRVYTVDCKTDESQGTCAARCDGAFQGRTAGTSRGDCHQWWVLSEVCYVVNPATGLLDTAGNGCVPSDGEGYAAASFSSVGSNGLGPRRYKLFKTAPGSVTLSSVPITVRSSEDPYVVALRLTGGTLSFGLSTADKAKIGSSLLIIGIVLTVCTFGGAYAVVRGCARKRKAPLDAYPQGGVVIATDPSGAGPHHPGAPPAGTAYYAQPMQPMPPYGGYGGANGYPPQQQPPMMQQPVMYGGQPGGPYMQPGGGGPMYGGGVQPVMYGGGGGYAGGGYAGGGYGPVSPQPQQGGGFRGNY